MTVLKTYLEGAPISQADMAKALGISQGAVSRMASGKIRPSIDTAALMDELTDGQVPTSSWVKPHPLPSSEDAA